MHSGKAGKVKVSTIILRNLFRSLMLLAGYWLMGYGKPVMAQSVLYFCLWARHYSDDEHLRAEAHDAHLRVHVLRTLLLLSAERLGIMPQQSEL